MFTFSTNLSDIFRIIRRIQLDVIINVHKFSDKVSCYSYQSLNRLEILHIFSKNPQILNCLHCVQLEPNGCMLETDGLADRYVKDNSRFS